MRYRPLPSYNHTLLVELGNGDGETGMAVYKPSKGEAPLWDFPPNTLYMRERLAYVVSECLDWGLVPLTVVRDGPFGIGSMQLFIEARKGMHYFNLYLDHQDTMMRIGLFDCVINNCDRKGGHCLVDQDDRIWAIDHGLSFVPGPKVRTVMWELADEPIPEALKKDVARLCGDSSLRQALVAGLAPREVEAFYQRVETLLESPTVPLHGFSDPYRPYPWPTI